MPFKISALLVAALFGLPAFAGPNLVKNGEFTKQLEHWKVDFPQPNETKYLENPKWVAVVDNPQGSGTALKFTLNGNVAASQGVKACTEMMEVNPDANYEFGAELFTKGPTLKVFLEGYIKDEAQQVVGNDFYPGFSRVYRCVIHVRSGQGGWATEKLAARLAKLEKRYKPTHVVIKLYAYWPEGEVYWRNVFLRKVGN